MSISMHSSSAPLFVRSLTAMLTWLDKAEESAKARNFDPKIFLTHRLAPDMFPFVRQVQVATDSAKNCVARLSGAEPPTWEDNEDSTDALRERIQKTIDYVESISASDIDGSETREILMPAGPDRTLKFEGQAFLTGFSIPNFYFHAAMAYALLREAGVDLGKMDFLGAMDMRGGE